MAAPIDRQRAIREAVKRTDRERRIRETRPEHHARFVSRYRGKVRSFDLVWVEEECGYRREFARDSAALWEDPQVFSDAEVQALTRAGAWCGSGSAHHVHARAEQAATGRERTGHQRPGFTGDARR